MQWVTSVQSSVPKLCLHGSDQKLLAICLGTKCNVYHASSSVDTVQEPKSIEWPGWASQPSLGEPTVLKVSTPIPFLTDGSWLVIFLESGRVCLKPDLYYYQRNLFVIIRLFVCFFVYSPSRLKYSILCAITAEHCRIPGNIKRACRAAWCEPCQDKQTWHIKQENETLLLSPQI